MLIWSSIFSAASSSNLCFRVSIQNLCIFLVSSLNFKILPKSSIFSPSFLSFFSAKALLLHRCKSSVSCPYLSRTPKDRNEIWRTPSMWINILENRMVRQLKRLCSWLTVKCTFLLHVSHLLGSFSSCTLYFARLALIRCCHLCHLPYFTENPVLYTPYIWRFILSIVTRNIKGG